MRKLTLSSSILFTTLILFSFNSCKREISNNPSDNQIINTVNPEIITKVNSWLDNQKSQKLPNKNSKLDSLKNNLDFNKLRFEKLNQKDQFLVIPINKGFITLNHQDKNPINTLVLVLNDTGITRGSIIQYISEIRNSDKSIPINTFSNIFNNKTVGCDGKFEVLTITDELKYELSYKNGKMRSYSIPKNELSSGNAGNGDRVQQCWNTFWVTYWSDGSITEQYLYTWCDGQCTETRLANGSEFRVNCGGGGGGGSNPPDCCIPMDNNIQISSSNAAEYVSWICGTEGVDPNTGKPIKTCTYSWIYNTNHLLTWTWKYTSIETSNLEKEAGVWKFILGGTTHTAVAPSGTIPPCISFSNTVNSAVASIDGSRLGARMDLIYTETFNVTCCSVCSPSSEVWTASTPWNAQ